MRSLFHCFKLESMEMLYRAILQASSFKSPSSGWIHHDGAPGHDNIANRCPASQPPTERSGDTLPFFGYWQGFLAKLGFTERLKLTVWPLP